MARRHVHGYTSLSPQRQLGRGDEAVQTLQGENVGGGETALPSRMDSDKGWLPPLVLLGKGKRMGPADSLRDARR